MATKSKLAKLVWVVKNDWTSYHTVHVIAPTAEAAAALGRRVVERRMKDRGYKTDTTACIVSVELVCSLDG